VVLPNLNLPFCDTKIAASISKATSTKVKDRSVDTSDKVVLEEADQGQDQPGVSHLLFADDTLLFFRASADEATSVKQVIDMYAKGGP
jgi:hypothetical protein